MRSDPVTEYSDDVQRCFEHIVRVEKLAETRVLTGPAPPPACPDGSCAGQADPPHLDITVVP